ncbi:50S ribosomal protein L39e [Candidatus Woesearchaeota archaeon]|nr:50S ribosomal protein L39e [Candidatus Woesearchaeota archaeon]
MARYKHLSRKKRLAKLNTQTRWAPYWAVMKKFGKTRRMHPSRITAKKRNWRRIKNKA